MNGVGDMCGLFDDGVSETEDFGGCVVGGW